MFTGIETTPLFNENCAAGTLTFSSERLLRSQPSEHLRGLSLLAEVLTALVRTAQHGNVKEGVGLLNKREHQMQGILSVVTLVSRLPNFSESQFIPL